MGWVGGSEGLGDGGKEQLPFIRSCSGGVCVCVQGPCVGQGREKERMALDQQLCVSRPACLVDRAVPTQRSTCY